MPSKDKREKPAMHQAWLEVVRSLEGELRNYRAALSHHQNLKLLRRVQKRVRLVKRQLAMLYMLRVHSKTISHARWIRRQTEREITEAFHVTPPHGVRVVP